MHRRLFLLSLLAASQSRAQGFAGLGQSDEGFARPDPARPITFPADHAPHPDYRIEWWYLTAPLRFDDGTELGIQWTLFRSALSPEGGGGAFTTPQAWLGHAAITTATQHLTAERYARGGTGQAGATGQPFHAWIDDWQMSGETPAKITLAAAGPGFRYRLALTAEGPLIRHGEGGFSRKSSAGQASYYYSQPFYRAEGEVDLGDGARPVRGTGWLDREWSSQPLAADQTGWDWFSLNLSDGRRLMGFRLRGAAPFVSGTLIEADGTTRALGGDDLRLNPREAHEGAPVLWSVTLPGEGIDLTVRALNPGAWMDTTIPYWEGPVAISGSHTGRGYLEMTGYERG